ncbi:MAG: hypothetical protein K0S68_196 [Candidatus Saccharibacteria bacterium]|nr:hypothetical protein [Candidatus Saccharibacteria bacterium]
MTKEVIMSTKSKSSIKLPSGWPWLVGIIVVVGLLVAHYFTKPALQRLHNSAQTPASMGSVLRYEIREDSGATAVNAVHVKGTYSTDALEFVGVDGVGSDFAIATETKGDGGKFSVARGSIQSVKGDRLVATLLFKSRGGEIPPAVTVSTGETILVATETSTNIVGTPSTKVYVKEPK